MSRRVTTTIFWLYALSVVAITMFPITPHPQSYWIRAGEPWWTTIHWIPFDVDAPSTVLNVIMFVPFGVLVPLLRPATDAVRRIAAYGAGASALIELTQFVLGVTIGSRRTVDVNDLLANTAGAVIGLLLLRLAIPLRRHRAELVRRRAD